MSKPRISDETLQSSIIEQSNYFASFRAGADCIGGAQAKRGLDALLDLRDCRAAREADAAERAKIVADLKSLHDLADRLDPAGAWGENVCAWAVDRIEQAEARAADEKNLADQFKRRAEVAEQGYHELEQRARVAERAARVARAEQASDSDDHVMENHRLHARIADLAETMRKAKRELATCMGDFMHAEHVPSELMHEIDAVLSADSTGWLEARDRRLRVEGARAALDHMHRELFGQVGQIIVIPDAVAIIAAAFPEAERP